MIPIELLAPAIFAFVIFIAILLFIIGFLREKRRRKDWERLAQEINFKFLERDYDLSGRFSRFNLFTTGGGRKAKNVLIGRNGDIKITVTDYEYNTGGGKNQQKHRYTVCVMEKTGIHLPAFNLRKQRRLIDFLGKIFGGEDIDIEEDLEFSANFVLQGVDQELVRQLFANENLRDTLLEYAHKNIVFEGCGDAILVHNNQRIKPARVLMLLEQGYDLLNACTLEKR